MAHASTTDARPIRFERVYAGPVDDLWALWTTKDGLEEWFAPEGCRIEVPAVDARAGGSFDHVMIAEGAEAVAYMDRVGRPRSTRVRGRFVEVVLHERLHIRMTIDFAPGVEPYPYDIVVEFRVEGGRVRMVVSADAHPDAEMTHLAREALESQLRQFEAVVAAGRENATR